MIDHREVYKIAKKDTIFRVDLKNAGEEFPMFSFDDLEMGIWAATYSGWVLGRYGDKEHERQAAVWRTL